ncbi:DNA polymerase III subunit delta [Enterococcus sp. DIV0242_7C1]|uniref:DNA polymerase III subunit delta n=1 Tax=Candidatus Enterococcus dunnyi TaxID=1834192 RepID=A0A200JEU1_9ENTE|nr:MULTISPECIES: DNA polymerase III subunit delta [unclassified Enterococcus]MBO0469049.1 DNA polymerase III subunit delta [Enterococcus sp. DIV0242_7C1]OUZ35658.1 DNA polymerase III, delta subunit [Enterococcus sp. 9D6_DIV0238]
MNLQEALQQVRQQQFASVYLVQGTEGYLSELFKTELMNQLIKTEDDQFNYSSFDMEEVPLSVAIEEAETIPFFGDYRLVFIENPYFLTAERKTTGLDHDIDSLLKYLEEPSPTTILVFNASVEKLDERKKITKSLKKQAAFIDVNPMGEREVRQYIEQTIQSEGYDIRPEAFDLLLQLTDLNLSKVMGELQKLFLFSSEDKIISLHAVKELVPKSLEHNVFDLTNEVLSGNGEKTIQLYEDLLLQGEETIKLNAILLNQIRLFLQTKILAKLGYQQANIADTLKIHPYRVKLALQQVRRFELERLEEIYDELVENDVKMKTGKMDKELLFELFILKLSAQGVR